LIVFSSEVGREKQESGDSSENGFCNCGSPARCCQPAVAGGVVYADLWGELSTHLDPQALFTQSSPVREPLLQAFPFPSTLGEVTLHLLFQACVFIYSSRGRWVFPPLLWSFPPTPLLQAFLLLITGRCCCSCQRCVCLQLTWEVGLLPSPVGVSSLRHSHKLSCSWLLGTRPCSRLLWPGPACLFTVWEGFPSPLFGAQGASPSLLCIFIVVIAY
jgi:hypothetical protein